MAVKSLKPIELLFRRAFLKVLEALAKLRQAPKSAHTEFGESPSMLFLRQDRLGDVLMSTFMIEAIRARYPKARLAILLGKNNIGAAPLLKPPLEIFVYSKNLGKDIQTIRSIRKQGFDLAVDLTDNASVTSSILLAAIGAKTTIGVEKENAISYDITVPQLHKREMHITDRVAELLRPLGIDPSAVDKKPVLNIESKKVSGTVGLNVSSRTPDRSAPAEASASIACSVLDFGFHRVTVFCAPHERWRGEQVVKLANDERVELASKTSSFKAFAEQVATCEYLITVDTSIIQIAAAADIPMVLLFNPMFETSPWTPRGVPFEIHTQFPNLAALEPEPVMALFRRLVAQTKPHHVQPSIREFAQF